MEEGRKQVDDGRRERLGGGEAERFGGDGRHALPPALWSAARPR